MIDVQVRHHHIPDIVTRKAELCKPFLHIPVFARDVRVHLHMRRPGAAHAVRIASCVKQYISLRRIK